MKKFNFKAWLILLLVVLALPFATNLKVDHVFASGQPNLEIVEQEGVVSQITGDFKCRLKSLDDVYEFLDQIGDKFNITSSKKAFQLDKMIEGSTGDAYRLNQVIDGKKVYGGQITISLDKNDQPTSISGPYYKNLKIDDTINYEIADAEKMLQGEFSTTETNYVETVYTIDNATTHLSYVFEVLTDEGTRCVHVSARSLAIVKNYVSSSGFTMKELPSTKEWDLTSETKTLTDLSGKSVELQLDKYTKPDGTVNYVLGDHERGIYVADGKNRSDYYYEFYASSNPTASDFDAEAVEAFEYLVRCYDFYANEGSFGVVHDGIQNNAGRVTLIGIVNFGNQYMNAGFVPGSNYARQEFFIFGDGNSSKGVGSFVRGLDVVGHEYQHGLSDSIVRLETINEAGALSEAISDMFGAFIEGHSMDDDDFWRMGEDLYLQNDGTKFFRDMKEPWNIGDGGKTQCVSSYKNLQPLCTEANCQDPNCDSGHIHYNCTLFTYAMSLLYERDKTFFNQYNILSLWYKTLEKLTPNATFEEFAQKMVLSANDLGWSNNKKADLEYAFASIDLPGYVGKVGWNNENIAPLEGSGTIAKPYMIYDVGDLASMAYYINEGDEEEYMYASYSLRADLDLQNVAWTPIGSSDRQFNGSFSGGGHTIYNLNLSNTITMPTYYNGFIGYAGEDANIYNLNIGKGQSTSYSQYTGAIVGKLVGTISNCSSLLSIKGATVGGIVGLVQSEVTGQTISNCLVDANLEGTCVGGIVGAVSNKLNTQNLYHPQSYISTSYAKGQIKGACIGGIVGQANSFMVINCLALSTLVAQDEQSVVGGLVGKISFKNIDGAVEQIYSPISNDFVTSYFAGEVDGGQFAYCFGEFTNFGSRADGNILIEKCVFRKVDDDSPLNPDTQAVVNNKGSKIVEGKVFDANFDFDNAEFFNDENNFIKIQNNGTFTSIDFKFIENQLPTFYDSAYWINNYAYEFAGGSGTRQDPFQIATAEQLSLLSVLMLNSDQYGFYNRANYILTADIDLKGKLWSGIGYNKMHVRETNGKLYRVEPDEIKAFEGTFDGNNHTIFNLTSTSLASVDITDGKGLEYEVYSFSSSLFGWTSNAQIYDLTVENATMMGSVVGGIVENALGSISLRNIKVVGGSLSATHECGGLIADYVGAGSASIVDCYVDTALTGSMVGGVIGAAYNGSSINNQLSVINLLFKGTIRLSNVDSSNEGFDKYTRAGAIIGTSSIKTMSVINCILLGQIISYNSNCYVGEIIGEAGYVETGLNYDMTLTLDGNKFLTKFNSVFDVLDPAKDGEFVTVVAGVNGALTSSGHKVNVNIDQTNYTNNNGAISKNVDAVEPNGEMTFSDAEIYNSEVYDFYSPDYYKNEAYFDKDYFWSEAQQDNLFVIITFRNSDGTILGRPIKLKEGQTLKPSDIPTATKADSDQLTYTFLKWNKDPFAQKRTTSIYAIYEARLRDFKVQYVDSKGNVIAEKTISYGSLVDQSVEAPEKKSDFFFDYTFVRWGKKGQQITSDTIIKPVYSKTLTGAAKVLIIFIVIMAVAITIGLVMGTKRRYKKKFQE